MSYKFLFLVNLFLYTLSLSAQDACLVQLNKSFYVSGEVIWYKIYLPNSFPAGENVITVSLVNQKAAVVDQSFLQQQSGKTAYGYYKIPYECQADVYRLVFSATEEETNRPILLAEVLTPIYNDFEEVNVSTLTQNEDNQGMKNDRFQNGLQIEIEIEQDRYTTRSQVGFKIKVRNEQGEPVPANLSISVGDASLTEVNHPLFAAIYSGQTPLISSPLEEALPIRGKLYTPNGQSLLNSGNIGAYLINQEKFLYAKSNLNGEYALDLPIVSGQCPIHFGGLLPKDLLVKLDQSVPVKQTDVALPYPPEIVNYLALSRKRKTIYQLYGSLENQFEATFPPRAERVLKADFSFKMDEYTSFPDIPTFFKEIIVPLKFRSRKGEPFTARMFDPTQPTRDFYLKGPLFIVDGRLTNDADFIAKLDIKKIESVELFYVFDNLTQSFGPLGYNGVMIIQSRNRDIEIPVADQKNFFQINGFQPIVSYPIQIQDSENSRVRLQPALFWAPNLQTNADGEIDLQFQQGDDHSRFRIEVIAQSETGARGYGTLVYWVGEK